MNSKCDCCRRLLLFCFCANSSFALLVIVFKTKLLEVRSSEILGTEFDFHFAWHVKRTCVVQASFANVNATREYDL